MQAPNNISINESLITERYQYFDKSEQFDLSDLFIQKGYLLPKPSGFNLQNFVEKFAKYIKEDGLPDAKVSYYEHDLAAVRFSESSFLGLRKTEDTFFLSLTEGFLIYTLKSHTKKQRKHKMLKAFEKMLKDEQNILNPVYQAIKDNVLIQKISSFEELSMRSLLAKDEVLLAALPVKSIRTKSETEQTNDDESQNTDDETKPKSYYYVLTDKDAAVVGFCKSGRLCFYQNMSQTEMKLTGFWFFIAIQADEYKITPERSSIKNFKRILTLNTETQEKRIQETASLNFEKKQYTVADNLVRILSEKTGDPFYELSRLFATFVSKKAHFLNVDDRSVFFKELRTAMSGLMNLEKYKSFLAHYNFSHKERAIFMLLMLKTASNTEQFQNGLPVAEYIYDDYNKQCRAKSRKLMLGILYAKYLTGAQKFEKAEKIIEKIIKIIPEEELTLLMPERNIDLSQNEAGKFLLTAAYDLFIKLNPGKSEEYLHKLAIVQPLNKERLHAFVETESHHSAKAKNILALLESETTSGDQESAFPSKYQQIKPKSLLELLKHPAERSKGSMSYIKKWLKNNDQNKYSAVKSFTKPIIENDYPDMIQAIRSVAQAVGISEIELYSAEGKMAQKVIGYHDEPPFLVIGKELLKTSSSLPVFLAAREIAHIAFGHYPISSKDSWHSFSQNGYILLDSFSKSVSAAGLPGESLREIDIISNLTDTMSKISKESKQEDGIVNAAAILYQFLNKPLNFDRHDRDNKRLLLAGRLLQATADRAGLLFAINLRTAVEAMISSGLPRETEDIDNMTLSDILKAKNNDNSYRYPELVVRFLNLFSFYLSDDYDKLKKSIKQ